MPRLNLCSSSELRNISYVLKSAGILLVNDFSKKLDENLAIVQDRILGKEGKLLGQNMLAAWEDWQQGFILDFLDLVKAKRFIEADKLLVSAGAPKALKLDTLLSEGVDYAASKADGFKIKSDKDVRSVSNKILMVLIVTIALIFLLSWAIIQSITKPLNKMVSVFNEIEKSKKLKTSID